MSQFDAKIFNPAVFGRYLERVPRVKQNKLLEAGVMRTRNELKAMLGAQSGGNYVVLPMTGLIEGTPLNYDGSTNITADSSKTYEQGMVVVGRAKAWIERDFSADITGEDFMDNIAKQVATFWEDVDQATMLSVLKGIFLMTGTGNATFVSNHTLDITGGATDEAAKVGATTLNTAIQKASGDNKAIFKVVICHSVVATNLENISAINYLKYTDAKGVERELGMATWNGRLVLVDDSVPAVDVAEAAAVSAVTGVKAKYTITISTKAVAEDALAVVAGGVAKSYICDTTAGWAAGANVAADCTALQALLAADFPLYTVTKTASTVIMEQKTALAETAAAIVINKKDSTGSLAGSIAETTAGVTAVAAVAAIAAHTAYTSYILGDGAFDYSDVGAKVPSEMLRDPATNGGQDTMFTRQRKVFAPRGISFTKVSMVSASPTATELELGANWELVNDGHATSKTYLNHKAVPIARIISKG
jgi:hypothetical protein